MRGSTATAHQRKACQRLPSDVLALIFGKALPRPGVIITQSLLAARHEHLTEAPHRVDDHARDFQYGWRAATVADWNHCACEAEVPRDVQTTPPWCRSKEADRLYSDAGAGMPWMLVCKQWRDVAKSTPIELAMCGVEDRPPSTTPALFVAGDSGTKRRKRDRQQQLGFLTGYPRLHTVMIWKSLQGNVCTSPTLQTALRYPLLPTPLPQLRNLCFLKLPATHIAVLFDLAFAKCLEPLTELRTLMLAADCDRLGSHVRKSKYMSRIVRLHRHLETLLLKSEALDIESASYRPTLRHLTAWPDQQESPTLKDLVQLRSLRLMRGAFFDELERALRQLQPLSRLTRLVTQNNVMEATDMQNVAQLPALEALSATVIVEPLALAQLSSLTQLERFADFNYAEFVCTPMHIQQLSCLTALRDLDIWLPEDATANLLSALSQLTSLRLKLDCTATKRDCDAVGTLTGLKRLHISTCKFESAGALDDLQPLSALHDMDLQQSSYSADCSCAAPRVGI